MYEEEFSPKTVNFKALDAALREGLGANYSALTISDSAIRVFLNEEVSRDSVQAIVDAHDPMQLTPEQQAEIEAAAAVEAAREEHPAQLELSQFEGESASIQELAAYVAWLELEIRDLRGL